MESKPKPEPDTPEANAELDSYMDERMGTLDKMVEKEMNRPKEAPKWDSLLNSEQDRIEDAFLDKNYVTTYEDIVEQWREDELPQEVKEEVANDHGWHDRTFIDWASAGTAENRATVQSAYAAVADVYSTLDYDHVHWSERASSDWPERTKLRQLVLGISNEHPNILAYDLSSQDIVTAINAMPDGEDLWKHADGTPIYNKWGFISNILSDINSSQKLVHDGGHGPNNEMNIDWSKLQTRDGSPLDVDAAKASWEKYHALETEAREKRLYQEQAPYPPDRLSDQVRKRLKERWEEMENEERVSWAVALGVLDDGTIEQPKKYRPFSKDDSESDPFSKHEGGSDYKKTHKIATMLQEKRTVELGRQYLEEIGVKDVEIPAALMAKEIWGAWVTSSTTPISCALQRAAAKELNGRLRMDKTMEAKADSGLEYIKDLWWNDAKYGHLLSHLQGLEPSDRAHAIVNERRRISEVMLRAHIRATWEASQYVLRKAGIEHFDAYRAIFLDSKLIKKEEKVVQSGLTGDEYIALPNIRILKNGAASFAYSEKVPNNWQGIGSTIGKERIIIQTKSPRTAALSLPCFGKNTAEEQEVVLAGTFWNSWTAWLHTAPAPNFKIMNALPEI